MAAMLHMMPLGSAWLQWDGGQTGQQVCDSLAQDTANLAILGDGRGKTALSFQVAVSLATYNSHVTFIRPHVLSHVPAPVHGMPTPEPAALQLVKLWYPESAEEVVSWCAHIHMQSVLPEAIIIDDLDVFITQSKNPEHGAARLIAALVDAAAWIASKSERCKLIFTASHRVTVLPSVLRQFHFRIAELQKSSAGGENDFQLTLTHPSSSSKNVVTVDYTITGDNIMLRTVTSRSLPTDKTVVPAV